MSSEGFIVVDFVPRKKAKSRKEDLEEVEKEIVGKECCGNKYSKEQRQQISDDLGFLEPVNMNNLSGCGTDAGVYQCTQEDSIIRGIEEPQPDDCINSTETLLEMGAARCRGLNQNIPTTPETQYLNMMWEKVDELPESGAVTGTPRRHGRCGAEALFKSDGHQVTNKRKRNHKYEAPSKTEERVYDPKERNSKRDNDNLDREGVCEEIWVKMKPMVEELVGYFVTHYQMKNKLGDGVPSNSPLQNQKIVGVGSRRVRGRRCNIRDRNGFNTKRDNENLDGEGISELVRVKMEPVIEELVEYFVTHFQEKPSNYLSRNQNSLEMKSQEVKGHMSRRKNSMPMKSNQDMSREQNNFDDAWKCRPYNKRRIANTRRAKISKTFTFRYKDPFEIKKTKEGCLVMGLDLKKKTKNGRKDLEKLERVKKEIVKEWVPNKVRRWRLKERIQQKLDIVVPKLESKINNLKKTSLSERNKPEKSLESPEGGTDPPKKRKFRID